MVIDSIDFDALFNSDLSVSPSFLSGQPGDLLLRCGFGEHGISFREGATSARPMGSMIEPMRGASSLGQPMTVIQSSLKVGVDVPWVTSWTSETITGVGPCPSVGGRPALCQTDHAGFGKPQYSKNHLLRQRLSVSRMLCPMCGEPTPDDDRWTTTGKPRAAGWLRAHKGFLLPDGIADDLVVIDAGAIAPLHRACAIGSMAQCPHLKADPDLRLIRFPKPHFIVPLLAEAEDAEGAAKLPPVIGFLQLCGVTGTIDRRWRKAA